jgi:hypothetical protein
VVQKLAEGERARELTGVWTVIAWYWLEKRHYAEFYTRDALFRKLTWVVWFLLVEKNMDCPSKQSG